GAVGAGNRVVRTDTGPDDPVPPDAGTRVAGDRNRSLGDLAPGDRVIVRVGADGTADRVLAVRAHATGTVTELTGDRATLIRPSGLTVTLDLSGVPARPAPGTLVIATGTSADNGTTLKVEELRELPTLG
ncbi:MAG TPA: hypothetical protein VGD43_12305, partial [Micromonospora sp.]